MAVIVRDLSFNYSSKVSKKSILNEVNLHACKGTIYALLGPSGCGKTTLLKIILGLLEPKSGSVLIHGYKPNTVESGVPGSGVGYMPQELAIQSNLTIHEILVYFGNIHLMSKREMEIQERRLTKLFNLMDTSKMISCLSGGQKRLVSLTVALLHSPRLLILDEASVGVDPLLREVIWNVLINLSITEEVTTIITTHYIQEARRANCLAFLRKGEILCEGSPNDLMNKYNDINSTSLDNVFVNLCYKQGPRRQSFCGTNNRKEDISPQEFAVKSPFRKNNNIQISEFWRISLALMMKYMIDSRRNPFAIFILFTMAISSVTCVTLIYGGTPFDLPVAWVVDECNPNNCSSNVNSNINEYLDSIYLPDILKQSLNTKIFNLIDYPNMTQAIESLKRRKVDAIVHLGPNFSSNYLQCDLSFNDYIDYIDNDTIHGAMIELYSDYTNPVISVASIRTVEHALFVFRSKIAQLFNISKETIKPPIAIEGNFDILLNEVDFNYNLFVAPAWLVLLSFGYSTAMSLLPMIADRQDDMSVRVYASGVKTSHRMMAHIFTNFLTLSISALLNLYATVVWFGIPCKGSPFLIVSLLLMQVLLGITSGTLFASLFTKSMLSFFLCAMWLTSFLFTSGVFWSVESQPFIVQYFSKLLHVTHSVKSLRILMLKENASFHPQISNGFIISALCIIVNFIASLFLLKFKK